MTLRPVVVPARDVRHDEPRWWCEDGEQIGDDVSHFRVDELHDLTPEDVRDLDRAGWPFLAIVLRDHAEPIRASRPNTMVAIDNDVLEAIRRYARPGDTDGDIIARMVWAATRPGGTVAEPISPGR